MDIIFNEKDRTIVGAREENWITIVQVLGNGNVQKLLFPQNISRPVGEWLLQQSRDILLEKGDTQK